MRITLIQSNIFWADKVANLQNIEQKLAALAGKTDLALLPEMFTTGFCIDQLNLAEDMQGETVQKLKEWASFYQIAIAGSFIARENESVYNRGFFVMPDGAIHTADKRHLFTLGGEDRYFSGGSERLIVQYKGFNIFLLVCYDIRFPVWSRNRNNDYDLLIYTANFPDARIEAWDKLLPARAIENQTYVCGINRVGKDEKNNTYVGHSVLLNYKGQEMLKFDDNEDGVRTATISLDELNQFRKQFAFWQDADDFSL